MWYVIQEDELYHHGIRGQKWGIRRFQNPDGTLTDAGRKRYGYDNDKEYVATKSTISYEKASKIFKVGAAVTAAALVAVGGYALYKSGKLDAVIGHGRSAVNVLKEQWKDYKGPVASLRATAKSMADDELASKVKRANLENAYVKAYKQRMDDPKESRFDPIMKTLGSASGAVTALAGAYGVVKSAKGDKNSSSKSESDRKDLSSMSDQELRNYVNRASLENQYRNLSRGSIPGNATPSERNKIEKALDKASRAIKTGQNVAQASKELEYAQKQINKIKDR